MLVVVVAVVLQVAVEAEVAVVLGVVYRGVDKMASGHNTAIDNRE